MTEDRCGTMVERCKCVRSPGHDGPHGCSCLGSWEGEYGTDTFKVHLFPAGEKSGFVALGNLLGVFDEYDDEPEAA